MNYCGCEIFSEEKMYNTMSVSAQVSFVMSYDDAMLQTVQQPYRFGILWQIMCHLTHELNSFSRQLKTFLFAHY